MMSRFKQKPRRMLAIVFAFILVMQTVIGQPGLFVSANDAAKSDLQLAIEEHFETYESSYADSETAEMALATAKEQVQAVISANESGATFNVSNGSLALNAKGGTYTFTATVTAATSFATELSMKIAARPEPVTVVFDDQATVDGAEFDAGKTFTLVNDTESGKQYMKVEQDSTLKPFKYKNFVAQSGVEKLDFDKYPYVKLSFKSNDVTSWHVMNLYFGASTGLENRFDIYPYGMSGNDTDWKELLVNMKTGEFTFLKGTGTYGASGKVGNDSAKANWTGEGIVQFTFSDNALANIVDLEYIAYFGSKEEAESYPVPLANLQYMLENTDYTAEYTETATLTEATNIAKSQVQAVIDEWALDSGETATFVIRNEKLSRFVSGGTFDFDVSITLADTSTFDVSLSMKIGARPEPVAVVFDDEQTVNSAVFDAGQSYTLVNDTENGKTYMKVEQNSEQKPFKYQNFVAQSGLEKLDFDKYPYVKLSFKSNDNKGWHCMNLYFGPSTGLENHFDLYPYGMSGEDTDWKELLVNMKTGAFTFLKGTGTYQTSGTCNNFKEGAWSGKGLVQFTFSDSALANIVDLEYIAFFATEAQAKAYPGLPDDSVDNSMAILSSATFACDGDVASKQTDAHNEIARQLEELDLSAAYTLENGVFVAPTKSSAGSYTVDVVFSTGDQVTVTMQISKVPIKPLVWTFDNSSILSQFTADNADMKYENGYVKMTTFNPFVDDGFFLQGSPKAEESFDIADLPYVKLKYKISGAESAPIQFFYWLDNNNYYHRGFSGNDPEWDGDFVTVIADFSVLGTGETAVWLENTETGEKKELSYNDVSASAGNVVCKGNVKQLRLNLARQWNLDRTAEVEYVGFFPTLEEAQAYDGAAQERVDAALSYLNTQPLEIQWGEGYDKDRVIDGVKYAVGDGGVGCAKVELTDYQAPSETEEGSVSFNATIMSADKKASVTKTVKIGKKPSEPIVWRFNNSEFLSKFNFAYVNATIEDNMAKFVSTNPSHDDGFYFLADTPGVSDAFYLQNYPYIRLKYKREGVAPGQLYFYSDALTGSPNLGYIGYGKYSGDWYTSIVDATNRSYEEPMAYNYNLDTGETEEYYRNSAYYGNTMDWRGLSTMFRFNFARRANLDRTMYLEYIAFFPTLEDAQAYDEENERLKANAQLALQSYSASDVSYYEGYSDTAAQETACDIISELVGDEVKVTINKVSYSAPQGTTNGTYQFTANICNLEGEVLYTTSTYTLNISYVKDTEPVVFTFTNPAFIKRATSEDGTSIEANGYVNMTLNGEEQTSFALTLKGAEKFHLEGHPYIAFKVNATSDSYSIILNGSEYALGITIDGETTVVIDASTGKIYVGGQEVSGATVTIPQEKVLSLGMKFADEEVNVSYIAFFATLDEALSYAGDSAVLQDAITAIQALTLKCAYADAKTKDDAMAYALKQISAAMGTQVSIVSKECTDYVAAAAGKTGSITVKILIGAGSQSDSHYDYVTVTMTIGKKPSAPVVWTFDSEFITKYIQAGGNATLSSQDGVLIMETTNDNEDGFYFVASGDSVGSDFYLQDYPYVKMKYRYHSYGTSTGNSYFYFHNDEEQNAYRQYSIGNVANNDIWCSALLDMKDNTITLCDLENNIMLSDVGMSGSTAFHGTPTQFRVTMGRHVTCQRYAEIEYIAFFSSREEAEAYNNDYYYSAYDFNGVEYAKAEQDIDAPLTIETVIHPKEGQNAAMTVLSNRQAEGNNYYSLETTADGNVRFVYNGAEVLVSSGLNVFDGKWHQVAVTLENNQATLYADKAVVDTNTSFAVSDSISLKAPVIANDYTGQLPFVGNIYYVRLYNNVQTAEQLAASAYSKICAGEEALLAGWFMDKLTNEGQFDDVCGNNPMTLMDNYDLAYEGHEFLGNDYVKTEKSLTAEPKTFEFWMKSPKTVQTGTYTILSNKTDGSSNYTEIQLVDGQLRMVYNGSTLFTTTGMNFADNIWKHVAITLGDNIQLYVDGELEGTYSVAYTAGSDAQKPYYIGAGLESKKTPFVGKLSDVRIWSNVRTQDEIAANMQDYIADTAITEELLGSWKLDKQNYLEYTDDSANANTGTLYSAGWYKLENITGDYTLGAIGDTQSYMLTTPTRFEDTFEKLAEKIDDFNMKYLFHLGDITQGDTLMEYRYARAAYDHIEGKIPYSLVLGNHDYPSPYTGVGAEMRDTTNYNTIFPLSTFENQTFENSWFGGAYEENEAANIYSFLNVGDVEYIIFTLEFGPRDEILEWTGKILDQYPEKCGIITTHGYLVQPEGVDDHTGELIVDGATGYGEDFATANGGVEIWDELLSKHDNIGLLLCGHSQNMSINYRIDKGDYGNDVLQLMVDHSAMITNFPSQEGLMTLLSFDEKTGAMHTYWYSPFYDAYYSTVNEVTFDMSDNLVKKDRKEYFSEEVYKLEDYRSGDTFEYPDSKEFGYVFAGWYDPETKQPIATTKKSGDALAKFVDSDVLSVKMQVGLEKLDDGTYVIPEDEAKIRFVTTVDTLDYSEVAFMISTEKSDGTYTTPKSTVTPENSRIVYEKLYYIGKNTGDAMDYSPKVFSQYSNFFKTYTLNGIPKSAYGTNIKVEPYWVTLDGTTVYGRTRTICVNDIIKGYSER